MPDESHKDASIILRKEMCMSKNVQPGWDREEVFALIFCLCKHSSALEDCKVHKACSAQDHSKAVTGKET